MQCESHSEREAIAVCVSCGKALCDECDAMIQGKHYCEECGEKVGGEPIMQQKVIKANTDINGFLWFLFSLMPGAGHMYMGLMKKGVMILGAFLGMAALGNVFFGFSFIAMGSVLVYVYAFFFFFCTKKALERGEIVYSH